MTYERGLDDGHQAVMATTRDSVDQPESANTAGKRKRRMLAIFNPAAGRRDRRRFTLLLQQLHQCFELVVHETQGPGDAEAMARDAADRFDLILAVGGDGTINEIVNGLRGTSAPLAVYPLGTTNVLAAELGLPIDPAGFVRVLAKSSPREAWAGQISGRLFTLMVSVGFDALVVDHLDSALKRKIGKAAYISTALIELIRYKPRRYVARIDGVEHAAFGVIVAKGRFYGGRFTVAAQARVTDPNFHVCLLDGGRRMDVIRYAAALLVGRLASLPDVRVIKGRTVAISGAPDSPVQGDGDILAALPVEARIASSPLLLFMGEKAVERADCRS